MSIRKIICILFLLTTIIGANAQNNYTINYSHFSGAAIVNGNPFYNSKLQLSLHIYADTLSFCRYWSNKPSMAKKVSVISRNSHHGTLHHLKSDSVLLVSTYTSNKHFIKISEPYNWRILNDTTTIIGIKCIKAESDLGLSAWFAPSIPVNAGPYIYCGLPGLILQANDSKHHLLFIADSIQNDVPPLVYPSNIKIVEMGKVANGQ